MRKSGNPLISISALFLICLGLIGMLSNDGRDRSRSLPAVIVGIGIVLKGSIRRSVRRKNLLMELKRTKNPDSF